MRKPQIKGLSAVGIYDVDALKLLKWIVDWLGWLAAAALLFDAGRFVPVAVGALVLGAIQAAWPFFVSETEGQGLGELPVVKFGKREIKELAKEITAGLEGKVSYISEVRPLAEPDEGQPLCEGDEPKRDF